MARWIREYKADPVESFPGKGCLKATDEEIRRLKYELKKAQEEQDILKKHWSTLRKRISNEVCTHI